MEAIIRKERPTRTLLIKPTHTSVIIDRANPSPFACNRFFPERFPFACSYHGCLLTGRMQTRIALSSLRKKGGDRFFGRGVRERKIANSFHAQGGRSAFPQQLDNFAPENRFRGFSRSEEKKTSSTSLLSMPNSRPLDEAFGQTLV